ncbi:DUF3634 family protein [Polyangium fumosum]|uniref:DUF3634 family protein n=1 Tax=Polyangium fumosum TaxID=889272 RepID=A0A4U1INS2_9BACT|nr:DUF3634 family protein [Polyangium fumosum]
MDLRGRRDRARGRPRGVCLAPHEAAAGRGARRAGGGDTRAILLCWRVAWLVALGLVAFVVVVIVSVERTRRLLVVEAQAGKVARLSGRAPAELAADIEDVLGRSRATGTIVLRLEGGRVVVRTEKGIDETTAQQLRNVVGRFPVARLRTARRVERSGAR